MEEAVAAKKDVVMGVTKESQLTRKYKSVIDAALGSGYKICAMATFVQPEVPWIVWGEILTAKCCRC